MRYYYKAKDGKSYLNYKEPIENYEGVEPKDYVAITEAEFNKHLADLKK